MEPLASPLSADCAVSRLCVVAHLPLKPDAHLSVLSSLMLKCVPRAGGITMGSDSWRHRGPLPRPPTEPSPVSAWVAPSSSSSSTTATEAPGAPSVTTTASRTTDVYEVVEDITIVQKDPLDSRVSKVYQEESK